MHDTTIGWRFINDRIAKAYGTESMPETAENVAESTASSAPIRMPMPCARRPAMTPPGTVPTSCR
jgi:hypothetical protein